MFSYNSFLSKHLGLYNTNANYTDFINKFLYDNLLNFVMNYQDNSEIKFECKNCNKIKEEYEKINTLNLKTNKEMYLNKLSELELHNTELIHTLKSELNDKYQNEIKILNENHKREIDNLNKELLSVVNSKHELENELISLTNKKSIVLGNEGETELFNIFQSMNKKIIDKHKMSHACDMWIIDDEYKIIYAIESKNKKRIIGEDIDKFNFDLEYISNNLLIGDYKKYKIIGLFISLNTEKINDTFGSFSFDLNKIYISQQYVFKEFFEIYFKTIECLVSNKNSKSYDEVINLITNEYKKMSSLIELCVNINKNADEIIKNSNIINKELSSRVIDFRRELINMEDNTNERIKIENEIRIYILECIQNEVKINLKTIREKIKNTNIFEGKKLTNKFLINWAQTNSF